MRARADIVATKLGIILPSSSLHILPNLRAAKGPERSGGTPALRYILVDFDHILEMCGSNYKSNFVGTVLKRQK